jgi:hypothetical protein
LNPHSGVGSKLNISDYFVDEMGVSLNGKIDAITTEMRGGNTFLFKVKLLFSIFSIVLLQN